MYEHLYDKINFLAMCFHCNYNKTLECVVMLDRWLCLCVLCVSVHVCVRWSRGGEEQGEVGRSRERWAGAGSSRARERDQWGKNEIKRSRGIEREGA